MVNVHVPCMMPRLALEEMLLQQGLHLYLRSAPCGANCAAKVQLSCCCMVCEPGAKNSTAVVVMGIFLAEQQSEQGAAGAAPAHWDRRTTVSAAHEQPAQVPVQACV